MQIAEKTVVQFHYDLSDANGPIESSREHDPVLYLHGQTGLIDGLVEAMEGHSAGETFTVTIPPEKAYGEVRENALHKVQAKRLQGAKKWKMTGSDCINQAPSFCGKASDASNTARCAP